MSEVKLLPGMPTAREVARKEPVYLAIEARDEQWSRHVEDVEREVWLKAANACDDVARGLAAFADLGGCFPAKRETAAGLADALREIARLHAAGPQAQPLGAARHAATGDPASLRTLAETAAPLPGCETFDSASTKALNERDALRAHVAELEAVVGDLVELGIHRAKHPDVYAECVALRAKVAELEAKLAEARAEVERARAEGWEIGHRDGKEWTP